jgi:predicted ArsR family transcriptional regulator
MDRKKFCKTTCGLGIGSCVGFGLLSNGNLSATEKLIQEATKSTPVVPTDPRQIRNVLRFVDSSMDESAKKQIFERLGLEHTTNDRYVSWINGYKKDIKSFFEMVNTNKNTYWEKLEYNPDLSAIKVTGRLVDKCACPFAQCENPPKSLCNYCCKNYQTQMFEMLLEKKVKVQIDESFLLGGKRCSTTIFVDGKLQLEKI